MRNMDVRFRGMMSDEPTQPEKIPACDRPEKIDPSCELPEGERYALAVAEANEAELMVAKERVAALESEVASLRNSAPVTAEEYACTLAEVSALRAENVRLAALVPRWIPVGDMLPTQFQDVIVGGARGGRPFVESSYRECEHWIRSYTPFISKGVTHWQPMPKHPEAP